MQEDTNEKPNYYAIVPAIVRYDNELRANEKLLYGEITALANKTGICTASNNYFAKLFKVTPQAISKWIIDLKKRDYISIDYVKKGKEIETRNISIEVSTNIDRVSTKDWGGYQQKFKENNTSNNNINNMNIIYNWESDKTCECMTSNNDVCKRRSSYEINGVNYCNQHSKEILCNLFEKEDQSSLGEKVIDIINYFNTCADINSHHFKKNKKFKVSIKNKEAVKLIKARLRDGYTVNDFKDVIFIKYMDFIENEYSIDGKSSIRYYCPETLFASKHFAKYKADYDYWSESDDR